MDVPEIVKIAAYGINILGGSAFAAGSVSVIAGSLARNIGLARTKFYSSEQELQEDLPRRIALQNLEDNDITARFGSVTIQGFGTGQAQVTEVESGQYEIVLNPSLGGHNRFLLDHELAHIAKDHTNKREKLAALMGQTLANLVSHVFYETQADIVAYSGVTK